MLGRELIRFGGKEHFPLKVKDFHKRSKRRTVFERRANDCLRQVVRAVILLDWVTFLFRRADCVLLVLWRLSKSFLVPPSAKRLEELPLDPANFIGVLAHNLHRDIRFQPVDNLQNSSVKGQNCLELLPVIRWKMLVTLEEVGN